MRRVGSAKTMVPQKIASKDLAWYFLTYLSKDIIFCLVRAGSEHRRFHSKERDMEDGL
jgi:hypothetical protein